jgi:Hemopexin
MTKTNLDAALNGQGKDDGKAYLFKGAQYVRWDWTADRQDPGYPKSISEWGFPGPFDAGIDAAIEGRGMSSGKAYFFKGDQYLRYDWNSEKVDAGYPKSIDEWRFPRELFATGKKIDAAVNGAGEYARYCYFFNGPTYVCYDWQDDTFTVPTGSVKDDWKLPADFAKGVDAALGGWGPYRAKAYFFAGDKYARYNWVTISCDQGLAPASAKAWGLPFGRMMVGYNYTWAWDQYGSYFGASDWHSKWVDTLPDNLRDLKKIGITHVRIFLLCNGWEYGTAPIQEPRLWGPDARHFDPPDVPNPRYSEDLKKMLAVFKVEGMKVIPSFIDFKMLEHTYMVPDEHGRMEPRGGAGRYEAVSDPKKRAKLLALLEDLVRASRGFENEVYAWEVINEPSWATSTHSPANEFRFPKVPKLGKALGATPPLTEAAMCDFLREACARIEALGFESTVGHRFYDDLAKFPTGTKPQFHYYAKTVRVPVPTLSPEDPLPRVGFKLKAIGTDPGEIPPFSESQAFVGEFNGNAEQTWSWPELGGRDNDSAGAKTQVLERLRLLESKGYQLAMLWPELAWWEVDPKRPHGGKPAQMTLDEWFRNPINPLVLSAETMQGVEEFARR